MKLAADETIAEFRSLSSDVLVSAVSRRTIPSAAAAYRVLLQSSAAVVLLPSSPAYLPSVRLFSRDGEYPINQRRSRKSRYLAKKYEGFPLTCYSCEEPCNFKTPKAFAVHLATAHHGCEFFCGCKSGYMTIEALHHHQEFDNCKFCSKDDGGEGNSKV